MTIKHLLKASLVAGPVALTISAVAGVIVSALDFFLGVPLRLGVPVMGAAASLLVSVVMLKKARVSTTAETEPLMETAWPNETNVSHPAPARKRATVLRAMVMIDESPAVMKSHLMN